MHFAGVCFATGTATSNLFRLDHPYDRRGLFLDDDVPFHRAWGPTEWFGECENDINPVLWSSDTTPMEYEWEILKHRGASNILVD